MAGGETKVKLGHASDVLGSKKPSGERMLVRPGGGFSSSTAQRQIPNIIQRRTEGLESSQGAGGGRLRRQQRVLLGTHQHDFT